MNTTLDFGDFVLPLKRDSFPNEKLLNAFVKKCVTITRQTPEYRDWVSYIKDTLGQKYCAFTQETADELTIDIHHHPLTLYDITTIILGTYISNGHDFTSLDIIRDVIQLHYSNSVGFIPIVSSLHEKYHNGFLIIPPNFVQGTWDYLLETDGFEVDPDIVMKAKEMMKQSNNVNTTYDNWQNGGVNNV